MAFPISTSIHWLFDKDFKNGIHSIELPISSIAKAGFKYADFNFLDQVASKNSPFLSDEWEKYIDYAGELASKYNLEFNQAHAPCHDGVWVENFSNEEKLKYIDRAIMACAKLGIKQMVYHPILFGDDWETVNRNVFSHVAETSSKYGVGVALENLFVTKPCPLAKIDCLINFADSFNDDNVGICWDTGHGNYTQGLDEFKEYADQYAMITKIGKRLKATHIHDNNSLGDDHISPFEGNINWKDVLRALNDINYKYSFTYEAHNALAKLPQNNKELLDERMRYMLVLAQTLVSDSFLEN